jgi:hypothetical protein
MGKYFAVIEDPHLEIIDTRENLAKSLLGQHFADMFFVFFIKPNLAKLIQTLCFFIGSLAAAANFLRELPENWIWTGFVSLILIYPTTCRLLFSNTYMVKKLLQQFVFWILIGFHVTVFVCSILMLRYSPPRIISMFSVMYAGATAICFFDARVYKSKTSTYASRIVPFIGFTLAFLTSIVWQILYILDIMDFDYTQIPLFGNVSIPVASIGMSSLQGIGVWALKCAWTLYKTRTDNLNILLIVHADVGYHVIDSNNNNDHTANDVENKIKVDNETKSSHQALITSTPSLILGNDSTSSEDQSPQSLEQAKKMIAAWKVKYHAAHLRAMDLELQLAAMSS